MEQLLSGVGCRRGASTAIALGDKGWASYQGQHCLQWGQDSRSGDWCQACGTSLCQGGRSGCGGHSLGHVCQTVHMMSRARLSDGSHDVVCMVSSMTMTGAAMQPNQWTSHQGWSAVYRPWAWNGASPTSVQDEPALAALICPHCGRLARRRACQPCLYFSCSRNLSSLFVHCSELTAVAGHAKQRHVRRMQCILRGLSVFCILWTRTTDTLQV